VTLVLHPQRDIDREKGRERERERSKNHVWEWGRLMRIDVIMCEGVWHEPLAMVWLLKINPFAKHN
jgi:hypothetical protein